MRCALMKHRKLDISYSSVSVNLVCHLLEQPFIQIVHAWSDEFLRFSGRFGRSLLGVVHGPVVKSRAAPLNLIQTTLFFRWSVHGQDTSQPSPGTGETQEITWIWELMRLNLYWTKEKTSHLCVCSKWPKSVFSISNYFSKNKMSNV